MIQKKGTFHTVIHIFFYSIFFFFLVFLLSFYPSSGDSSAVTIGTTHYVGGQGLGNHSTISEAIANANSGDTIFVFSGYYQGNLIIDKSLKIIGEHKDSTIISTPNENHIILILSHNVELHNLTIQGNNQENYAGIKVSSQDNTRIRNCNIVDNYYGIWLYSSRYNDIILCNVSSNYDGIWIHYFSQYNRIQACHLFSNTHYGIYLCCASAHNTLLMNTLVSNGGAGVAASFSWNEMYLNNFLDNTVNAQSQKHENTWDNGSRGNYWSDYDEESEGAYDFNGDGIGDSPYILPGEKSNQDRYPLLQPWGIEQNSPPLISIISPINNEEIGSICNINGTAYDNEGFIEKIQIKIDGGDWKTASGETSWIYPWDTTTIEDGVHMIAARSFDGHLYSQISTITIVVNNGNINQTPRIQIHFPPDKSEVTGTVLIKGIAQDNHRDVEYVEIRIDADLWITVTGTHNWSYQWDSTTANNGVHNISVRSFNGLLYSPTKTIQITVLNNNDNTPPVITIYTPTSSQTVTGIINITGTAIDYDGIIQSIKIKIDEESWITATGTTSWAITWDTHNISNGLHTLSARSYDGQDYSQTKKISVTVYNNHPPAVNITQPLSSEILTGLITITGLVHDTDGNETIEKVEIKIDAGEWQKVNGTNTWDYIWNTSQESEGEHTITVRAWDGEHYGVSHPILVMTSQKDDTESAPGFEFLFTVPVFTIIAILARKKKYSKKR
jgi:parallel beta-helix repeat protein